MKSKKVARSKGENEKGVIMLILKKKLQVHGLKDSQINISTINSNR